MQTEKISMVEVLTQIMVDMSTQTEEEEGSAVITKFMSTVITRVCQMDHSRNLKEEPINDSSQSVLMMQKHQEGMKDNPR